MENKRNIIVGLGEALWDVLPDGRKLGGAPANFVYHASQFGLNSCVVSAVGDDELGHEIENIFKEKSLNTVMPRVDFPTGTVQVTLDGNGIPSYEIKQGVAWDNIPYSSELEELASKTSAVCFGSLAQRCETSRTTIEKFLEKLPDDETLKVFDINLRQNFYSKELIESSFKRCNVLKINDEELVIVAKMFGLGDDEPKQQCLSLLNKYNLRFVILTCGENGSYVFTNEISNFIPTPKVDVKDTVGAGDSFTGAFVASVLQGKSMQEAHRLAVDVSAFVCQCNGAMPVYTDELKKMFK